MRALSATVDDDVAAVQRAYPRIYHACHVRHVRRATTSSRLSSRDAAILAHLEPKQAMGAGSLARHLGIAASTLSEALEELERLGYVARTKSARDRRTVVVALTDAGVRASADASVLDVDALGAVLARLTPGERKAAVRGMSLLARAAVEHTLARRPR